MLIFLLINILLACKLCSIYTIRQVLYLCPVDTTIVYWKSYRLWLEKKRMPPRRKISCNCERLKGMNRANGQVLLIHLIGLGANIICLAWVYNSHYFHWQRELLWSCSTRDWGRLVLSCCSLLGPKDTRKGRQQGTDAVFPPLSHPGTQKALCEAPRCERAVYRVPLYICKRYSPCPKSLLCNEVWDTATPGSWFISTYSFDDNGDTLASKLSGLTEDLY